MLLRPLLLRLEGAVRQGEESLRAMDRAGRAMERATATMDRELPVMSEEVRATANEFEVLGRDLSQLTAALTGRKPPPGMGPGPSRRATRVILEERRGGPLDEEGIAQAEKERFKAKVAARAEGGVGAERGGADASTSAPSPPPPSMRERAPSAASSSASTAPPSSSNGAFPPGAQSGNVGNGAGALVVPAPASSANLPELIGQGVAGIQSATVQVSSSVSSAISSTTTNSLNGALGMIKGLTDGLLGWRSQIGRVLFFVEGDQQRASNRQEARRWINAWLEGQGRATVPAPRTAFLAGPPSDGVVRPPPDISVVGLESSSLPAFVYRFTGGQEDDVFAQAAQQEVALALRRAQEAAEFAAQASGALERALKEVQEVNSSVYYSAYTSTNENGKLDDCNGSGATSWSRTCDLDGPQQGALEADVDQGTASTGPPGSASSAKQGALNLVAATARPGSPGSGKGSAQPAAGLGGGGAVRAFWGALFGGGSSK